MHLHLHTLKTLGFMSHDRELTFARGINVVVGPNGTGKTQLVESLRVLVRGTPSIVGASPDDLMLLSRKDPDGYTIKGVWLIDGRNEDSGPVIRTVSRNPNTNVVSQAISAPRLVSNSAGVAAKKAALAQRLGGWAEAWQPLDWRKGGADLRRTLVSLLGGGSGLRPEDFLPSGAPDYILPDGDAEQIIDIWVEAARERARTAARVAAEAMEQLVTIHADQIDHGGVAPDPQPIRDRMTRLHDERLRVSSVRDRRQALTRERADLDRERAALPATKPATMEALLRRIEALDEECRAYVAEEHRISQARNEAQQHNDRCAQAVRSAELALQRHRSRPEAMRVPLPSEELTADTMAQAVDVVEEASAAVERRMDHHSTLAQAAAAAEAEAFAAEQVRLHLASCPKCDFDLREHQALMIAALRRRAAEAAEAAADANRSLQMARDIYTAAMSKRTQIEWCLENARLATELERAHAAARPPAEVPRLQARDPRPERSRACQDADAAQKAWTKAAVIGRRELDLAQREAAIDVEAEGLRSLEEIEADLEAAEAELEQALNGQQRLRDFSSVVARKRAAATRAEVTREWVPRMDAIYTRVMDAIRSAIEVPCSRIGAADYRLVLQDPRGKPDCRLQRNGVDFATLSEGEQALATLAILRALGPTSGAEWRPLFVDRLQAIDPLGRQRVASAARQAIEAQEIDQAFLLGCIPLDEAEELVAWINSNGCPAQLINLGGRR